MAHIIRDVSWPPRGPGGSNSAGSSARTRTSAAAIGAIRSRRQPLKWLLDGARAGLICDHVTEVVPSPIGRLGPRDSFAEFATPFWTTVLRAKRSYRTIDPGSRGARQPQARENQPGFILVNINEHVDERIVRYWERRSIRRQTSSSTRGGRKPGTQTA